VGRLLRRVFLLLFLFALAGVAVCYWQPLWVADQLIRLNLRSAGVESKYVDVDGYKIHYFEARAPSSLQVQGGGTPLVLVHGLGARGEDWAGMIPSLAAQGFHVYAPDLLGYGRSPKPDIDYSIGIQERTVANFIKAVNLEKTDLGGWSMGGWIALKLTVDHPELVNRLVVYDAAGVYFPPTFDPALFAPKNKEQYSQLFAMLTPRPPSLPAFIIDAAIRRLQKSAWVIQRTVRSMQLGHDLLDFSLGQISRPTLIVWGGEDKLIPPSVGETMHRLIAGSSMLTIAGCGHLAPSECAKPVLQGTISFLKSDPAVTPGETTVSGLTH